VAYFILLEIFYDMWEVICVIVHILCVYDITYVIVCRRQWSRRWLRGCDTTHGVGVVVWGCKDVLYCVMIGPVCDGARWSWHRSMDGARRAMKCMLCYVCYDGCWTFIMHILYDVICVVVMIR